MTRRRLGKGLEALIPKESTMIDQGKITEIPLEKIKPNPQQPRKDFDQDKLTALADTINTYGVLQPIIVQKENDRYLLVAGERRFRAAQIAGLEVIPAVIKEYTNRQLMEITLVENLQREDLNPIEEASAYQKLIEEFGLLQDELAQKLGRSRSSIANAIRLLSLDDEVKTYLAEGKLTVGQVRPLLSLENKFEQKTLALKIVNHKLTARQVEKMVKALKEEKEKKEEKNKQRDDLALKSFLIKDFEDSIRKVLGTKVLIKQGKNNEGKIELFFYSDEDMERLVHILLKKDG